MKIDPLLIGIAIPITAVVLWLTFVIGGAVSSEHWRAELVKRGLMEYDQRTGVLEWKANRQSFDNATEVWKQEYKETGE